MLVKEFLGILMNLNNIYNVLKIYQCKDCIRYIVYYNNSLYKIFDISSKNNNIIITELDNKDEVVKSQFLTDEKAYNFVEQLIVFSQMYAG